MSHDAQFSAVQTKAIPLPGIQACLAEVQGPVCLCMASECLALLAWVHSSSQAPADGAPALHC